MSVKKTNFDLIESRNRIIVDQNGRKYQECLSNSVGNKSTRFGCLKRDSQKCNGEIIYDDQVGEIRISKIHSCRWTYEEAIRYCYIMYHGNPDIKTGYHPSIGTWSEAWSLLWTLHTETFNIWSHGIFIIVWGYITMQCMLDTSAFDYWINLFLACKDLAVFIFSASYHWLHIISKRWHCRLICLDHCGIMISSYGLHLGWIYYSLCQEPTMLTFFGILQVVVLVLTAIAMYKAFFSEFDNEFYDNIKNKLYLLQHCIIYVVVWHQFGKDQEATVFAPNCLVDILVTLASLGTAQIVYAARIPEVIWPGKFDLFLNSHNIMHVMIVIAAIFQRRMMNCLRDAC